MRRLCVLTLSVLVLLSSGLEARRGGGGFSRSRPSRISRPKPAPKKTAPARKKSSSLSKKKTATPNKATAARPKAVAKSKTDKALAKKNNLAAKKHGSRAGAQKAFKQNLKKDPNFAKNYPNKFDKQPAKRPDYIPGNVSRGGVNYNVTYMNGGYGYMGPLGTWIMLDMMTDIMVTDAMLSRRGYGTYGAGGAPMVIRTGPSPGVVFLYILGGIVVLAIVISIGKAVLDD